VESGYLFFAAFVPGLQNFIEQIIKERLKDVKIHRLLDGAVLFETETGYDKLNFFCFNNIFAVIDIIEEEPTRRHGGTGNTDNFLEDHIRAVIERRDKSDVISNNAKSFKSFRIVVSCENVPVSVDAGLRDEAEKYIAGVSGLKVNRSLPDTEFWFLLRREEEKKSFSVFMKRLTLRPSWEKTLHKGELPPPVAWTLCRLAALVHGDTVLDPFCGYGSVPQEALKHFHITKFIACDNNKEAALYTKKRFKDRKKDNFVFYETDFSALPAIMGEGGIDAIVTDPPWGQFAKIIDEASFYKNMFEVFAKLLKKGGRAVILSARDGLPVETGGLVLENSIPVLLSGKKAVIWVGRKEGGE
jgi:tRNA G10  N-methylase Trm11